MRNADPDHAQGPGDLPAADYGIGGKQAEESINHNGIMKGFGGVPEPCFFIP